MNFTSPAPERPIRLRRFLVIQSVLWSCVIGVSLFMNITRDRQEVQEQARLQAGIIYNRILGEVASNTGGVDQDVAVTKAKMRHMVEAVQSWMASAHEQGDSHRMIRARLISPSPQNPRNLPDAWERAALTELTRGVPEVWQALPSAAGDHRFRQLRPLQLDPSCRACHAQSRQGAGTYYGGVSISIPVQSFWFLEKADLLVQLAGHAVIWLVGLGGLWLMARNLRERIYEREHNRRLLRIERDFSAALIDTSGALVLVIDGAGRVIRFNRACERLSGYPAAEILGKNIWDVPMLSSAGREAARQAFSSLLSPGAGAESLEREIVWQTRDGRQFRIAWSNAGLASEEEGIKYIISTGLDITERHAMEEKIQQAQKLESLGVLAGGIAHDFNNLLMGILGYADLALLALSAESPARRSVQQIVTASLRAAELTRQMLAYSGKGKFVIEQLNLSRLVEEMTHLLQVSISKKAVLRFNFTPSLPPLEGDATQIRQVVMNLITNASDAIGEKSGVITVSTGIMAVDRSYLQTTFMDDDLPDGAYVYVEVTDTGCGMDAETRAKIFDPFFTTKFTGRGLGLAAVLGIVRGHKGGIKVYSEPGHGTTFKVLFPSQPDAALAPAAVDPTALTWRGSGTVLVVDDEESVRAVGKMTLELAGFRVLVACDGLEALEIFRAQNGSIALVILDMTMPHMNGEETFREMRRLRPDVCVILSSGYSEQEATNHFIGKGLSGFIQKPYRSRDLIDKVAQILNGETSS